MSEPPDSAGERAARRGPARVLVLLAGAVALGGAMLLAMTAGAWFSLRYLGRSSEVAVPDFTSMPVDEASRRAQEAGLGLEVAKETHDRLVGRNCVLDQSPPPGTRTRHGRIVKVVVSLGEAEIQVPDLTGRPAREALQEIRHLGLRAGVTSRVHSSGAEGVVLAQRPRPGEKRAPGDPVNLLVGRGPGARTWVMPDLSGLPAAESQARLERCGVRVATRPGERRAGERSGIVIAQQPQAGAPIRDRQAVSLTVSR